MSVHIVAKIPGNVEVFQKSLVDRPEEFLEIARKGKAAGALHHYFGVGPDYVLVIDEWETPQQFEAFFTEPSMQEWVATVGADTSVPPEITVADAVDSPDRF